MIRVKKINELTRYNKKWLIDGLILDQGMALLTAPPKTLKTWVSLDFALSVSLGQNCLDKFSVSQASPVLFANFEDTESIQKERLEMMLRAKGLQDAPNFNILTTKDRLLIDTTEGIQTLRSVVNEVRPKLLVLDCWVRLVQISETDSRGIAEVLHQLRKVRDDFQCAILLVHHAGKDTSNKRAGDRIRGSGEFFAWAETILALKMDSVNRVTLDCEHRAAESFQNLPVVLKKENEGLSVKVSSTVIDDPKTDRESYSDEDIILKHIGNIIPITLDDLSRKTNIEISELRTEIYRMLKNQTLKWTRTGYLRGSFQ